MACACAGVDLETERIRLRAQWHESTLLLAAHCRFDVAVCVAANLPDVLVVVSSKQVVSVVLSSTAVCQMIK